MDKPPKIPKKYEWMIPGLRVVYQFDSNEWTGILGDLPKNIGRSKSRWVVRIERMDPIYQAKYGRNTVSIALCEKVSRFK